jgi:transposase
VFVQREWLEQQLERGKSLPTIAKLVGKDASTVGYWVKKYGLRANGADKYSPKGGLTRDRLAPLVASGMTLGAIAEELQVGINTVRYWIDRHDLPRPIAVRRANLDRVLQAGERTVVRTCAKHGETSFVVENSGRLRCRRCRMERVAEWRRQAKRRLVAEAGGRCELCGYDRCMAALEFHHLDPKAKSFGLSMKGVARSFEDLKKEATKCALLCSNCHAEVEAGYSKVGVEGRDSEWSAR